jgi:hypothetical protein
MTKRDSASSRRIVHFCTVAIDLNTAKHGYVCTAQQNVSRSARRESESEGEPTLRSTLHLGKISDVSV